MGMREHRGDGHRASRDDLDDTIYAALNHGAHPTLRQQARARARLMQTVRLHAAAPPPRGRWSRLLDVLVRFVLDDRVYDRARLHSAARARTNLHRSCAILSLKYVG
jgi:hypothetical protein